MTIESHYDGLVLGEDRSIWQLWTTQCSAHRSSPFSFWRFSPCRHAPSTGHDREVGPGLSSPIVAHGRVFVTDVQLTRPATKERVLCFETTGGKPLWSYSYEAAYPERGPHEPVQATRRC